MLLIGCFGGNKIHEGNKEIDVNDSNGDYILTSPTGEMILFNVNGEKLSEMKLDSNKKSEFIYTMDEGNVYAKSLIGQKYFKSVVYAVDKNKGKLFVVVVDKKKLTKVKEISLKENKEIDKISAYNGSFFYSINVKSRNSNKYTFLKPEKEMLNGVIDYYATIPTERNRPLTTYVYVEDLTDLYLKSTGLDKILTKAENNSILRPVKRKQTFELPANADNWIASGRYIYFFFEGRMGQYDMQKNQIGLYYGGVKTFDSHYVDGRYKSVYALNNFGEDSSKSIIFNMNASTSQVIQAIELNLTNPIGMAVDEEKFIHIAFKEGSKVSNSKLRTVNFFTGQEVASVPLKYIPTIIKAHNELVYLMNPNEEYFMVGVAGSQNFSKYAKVYKDVNYTDLLLVNTNRIDNYYYDDKGRFVNEDGHIITADNQLVDKDNNKLNRYGQKLDKYNRAVNDNGELIDKHNNIIDENRDIVSYVRGEDGFFRNSKSQIVDSQGTILVQNENGDWVNPNDKPVEPIRGNYDENGDFIIDADYLEEYPDAYERLETQEKTKKDK